MDSLVLEIDYARVYISSKPSDARDASNKQQRVTR